MTIYGVLFLAIDIIVSQWEGWQTLVFFFARSGAECMESDSISE
jgi:hypothetical protein